MTANVKIRKETLSSAAYPIVEKPAHVGPPETLIGRVGVQGRVCVQVVVPVGGHPLNGVSLDSQNPAIGQRILQPLRRGEAAVAQLPVEAQRDPQAPCNKRSRCESTSKDYRAEMLSDLHWWIRVFLAEQFAGKARAALTQNA